MDTDQPFQTLWGKKLAANKKMLMEFPDEVYSYITSACLGEVTENAPSVLEATVETVMIDEMEGQTADVKKETFVVATLTPNQCEQAPLDLVFSPLNKVTLEVKGPNAIHVSGMYDALSDDDMEEEEEEEEEEMTEEFLVNKLMKLAEKEQKE